MNKSIGTGTFQLEKYFTPKIEDIRVGYECEANLEKFGLGKDNWMPFIFEGVGKEVIRYNSDGMYRVPYLTKEQILKEGWQTWNGAGDWEKTQPDFWVSKRFEPGSRKLWHVIYNFDLKQLRIQRDNEFVFKGTCRCINEFRQIFKFVNAP